MKVRPEDAPELQEDLPEVPNEDKRVFVPINKKDRILHFLYNAGTKGATVSELSKCSGVAEDNICFHIHVLRKEGHNIFFFEGRYIFRNGRGKRLPIDVKEQMVLPAHSIGSLSVALGDERLAKGVSKIQPEDRAAYIDLLKKIIYYRKCALGMIETNEIIIETSAIGE